MKCELLAAGGWLAVAAFAAHAQGWTPQRNVEIVVTSAPAGSNDRTARQVEKVLVENRLINGTLSVVNKPGGGGNIAFNYVNQSEYFVTGAQFRKDLDREYADMKVVLTELGLAKQ